MTAMNVLVLNPPSKTQRNVMRDVIYGCWCKGRRVGGLKLPPLGLLLTATVLKEDGFNVTLVDGGLSGLDYDGLMARSRDYDAVVSTTSSHTIIEDSACLSEMKERNPDLVSLVFGPRPTFLPELVLKEDAYDICIQREPDFIIRDVLRAMRDQGFESASWRSTKGISFCDEEGRVITNEPYPLINDLDVLPFADRSMLPDKVDYFNPVALRFPMTTMMVSRGCPARCTFCLSPYFYGNTVRYRSTENIMEELRTVRAQGYKEVFFRDETFTASRKRIMALCRAMIDENIDLTWTANARVGMLDREMAALMKKAGCHTIKFGVESGSQVILDRIRKGINLEKAEETYRWLERMGINTHAHFMIGHPGETAADFEQTIALLKRLRATTISIGVMTPYPGTPQFDALAEKHPEVLDPRHASFDAKDSGYLASLGADMTARQIEQGVKRAYRTFYMRPGYLARWLLRIKTLDDFKRLTLAGSQVFGFIFADDN